MLEEMRQIDEECGMEKFDTIDRSEKTIAILGDRRWSQTAKQQGHNLSKTFLCNTGKNAMSAQMLEVSLLGGETVLPLERDAWSMVK